MQSVRGAALPLRRSHLLQRRLVLPARLNRTLKHTSGASACARSFFKRVQPDLRAARKLQKEERAGTGAAAAAQPAQHPIFIWLGSFGVRGGCRIPEKVHSGSIQAHGTAQSGVRANFRHLESRSLT